MTDDDDQPQFPPGMVPIQLFQPLSTEEMENRTAKQHVIYGDFATILTTVLDEDQLIALRKVVVMCMNEASTGAQVVGMMSAISHMRFGNCIGCGEDHFKTREMTGEGSSSE